MIKIYSLNDPRDLSVRYVGKTISDLNTRLKCHICRAKNSKKHTHKHAWIKQLLALGLRPLINLIEVVGEDSWIDRERYWISHFKNLTNLSKGGESGFYGGKHSQETKDFYRNNIKNISGFYRSQLGKPWTEEQKEKRRLKPPWNKGMKGAYKFSEESRKRMSEAQMGKRKGKVGRKWTDEQKIKFKEAHSRSWETRRLNKLK